MIASELERAAWRQRNGLDPIAGQPVKFGTLLDWWRDRYRERSRAYSKEDHLKFLDQHLAELREFILTPATAGKFARPSRRSSPSGSPRAGSHPRR